MLFFNQSRNGICVINIVRGSLSSFVLISVKRRRQRAEQYPPAGVPLVPFGIHPVVVQAALGRYCFGFVQVPASQRALNQRFRFRLYVRLVAGPEELPLHLIFVTFSPVH